MEAFTGPGDTIKLKILFVYDQSEAHNVWQPSLNKLSAEVAGVSLYDDLINSWVNVLPDLILIEHDNPQSDVLQLLLDLRNLTQVPILVVTTSEDEDFICSLYEAGADECLVQPVSQNLFLAKLRSWFRHTRQLPMSSLDKIQTGNLSLDPVKRKLQIGQDLIRLSNLETRLMYVMMSNPNQLIDPDELIQKVWGDFGGGSKEMLKNVVYRLRIKIEQAPTDPQRLISVGKSGYKLVT